MIERKINDVLDKAIRKIARQRVNIFFYDNPLKIEVTASFENKKE